jgi:hypothetical protein
MFTAAITLCKLLSWTCSACRFTAQVELKAIRVELSELRKTIAQITSSTLTSIPNEIGNNDTLSAPTVHSNPSVAKPPAALPITRTVVLDTLREVARRKRNVIISGLVESGNRDQAIACDLIAIHVKCPQPPPILSCLRLGKTTSNNLPRKLLIRFSSETEATHLLK